MAQRIDRIQESLGPVQQVNAGSFRRIGAAAWITRFELNFAVLTHDLPAKILDANA
jgi:hypothetical protein